MSPHSCTQPGSSNMSYSWESLPYRKVHVEPARSPARHLSYPLTVPPAQGWSSGGRVGSPAKRSGRGHGPLTGHKSCGSQELTLSASFNDDYKAASLNEKQLLQGLNDRFAGYIDKVRQLEQQNRGLEAEVGQLRQRQSSPSRLAGVFEPELLELRQLVQELERQKARVLLERERLADGLQLLKGKCEDEARLRDEIETSARLFRQDTEESQRVKLELDKKAQALAGEIVFLKSAHREEVADLFSQLQASQVSLDLKDLAKPDLTAALREIRAQMEGYTSANLQQTEEWFRCRVAALSEAAEINNEALQNRRQEIGEFRRQLQSKCIELETVRGTKESLEKQLTEIEERHDVELVHYQDTFQQLENELKNTKWEMSLHLREYQDLLNVKMALDVEIASYRKLLEGEETRFGTIAGSFTPPSYTYRQTHSLTHSVYPPSKAKGTPTKAAPQYKFVEEIISETTKEVDMAELEDSVLRVICDHGSGEESTKQEEDEDKDEATTAEASDEEEAERTSETKEESAEEEGTESKEERVETKESEKNVTPSKEESDVAETETKSEEEPSSGIATEECDTVETKEDTEEETIETKDAGEEQSTKTKESENQEMAKAKDQAEQQSPTERKEVEEEKPMEKKTEREDIMGKIVSEEKETAEAKAEAQVNTKDKTESVKQGAIEEAQTEPSDAEEERTDEGQGEDQVTQQKEELKATSQKESAAAEVKEESKDQEDKVQPQKTKEETKGDEKEKAPQELAKESETQEIKVQTSEDGKMPEISGQLEKSNGQTKEEKVKDTKPDTPKEEEKETNQEKEISTQEEKSEKDNKESEEKTEKTSEAEKVDEKVAGGTPESKSTQSGDRSPEAIMNGLDIKLEKEEKEAETDKKMAKTSMEVIQKIAEKTIESREEISKVTVTSTVVKAVTEEITKEEKLVTAISDPESDAKESK